MTFRLALMGGTALMLAMPAAAQDAANIGGRVGKLEKEMRAVQRQVFPGGGGGQLLEPDIQSPNAPKPTASSSTATADLIARVDALESQLATLTGQVEQQGNSARSMDTRLKALESQARPQPEPAATGTALPAAVAAPTPVAARPKPVVTPPAAKPSAARTAAVAAIDRPATGDGFEDGYNYGYRLWESKFYPEAQVTLEETVTKYPKHKRASFARNLLGRSWLDDKKPATAVKVFYDNYKNDPRGERAPESLFFLGAALTDLGKTAEACEAFGELAKAYPDAAAGRLADRVAGGKTRAKCK